MAGNWTNGVPGRDVNAIIANGGMVSMQDSLYVRGFDLLLDHSTLNARDQYNGSVFIGSDFEGDALRIQNQGVLRTGSVNVGGGYPAPGSSLLVSGTGSRLDTRSIVIGSTALNNSVRIEDGADVTSFTLTVGVGDGGYGEGNNNFTLTGEGSTMELDGISVGRSSMKNVLAVEDGAYLKSGFANVGSREGGNENRVIVKGLNTLWEASGVEIGSSGSNNSMTISDF